MGNSMTCAVQQSDSTDCWGNTTDGRSNPSGSFEVVNGGLSKLVPFEAVMG